MPRVGLEPTDLSDRFYRPARYQTALHAEIIPVFQGVVVLCEGVPLPPVLHTSLTGSWVMI